MRRGRVVAVGMTVLLATAAAVVTQRRGARATGALESIGSWTLVLDRPSTSKYEDVSFADAEHGWIVNAAGDILATSDGGVTWSLQATKLGPLRSIEFIDTRRGFAGTLDGKLYTTEDGGALWNDVTSKLPRPTMGICGIAHVGNRIHIVGRYIGGAADHYYSTDAGANWHADDLREHGQGLVDIAFVSDAVGFIGGMGRSEVPNEGSAIILKTVDGGRSWRQVYVLDGGRSFAWKLWPTSSKIIYAALQSQDGTYRIAKTTDGGERWTTITVEYGGPHRVGVQAVGFLNSEVGWVGGFFGGMYATKNGGRTWAHVPVPNSTAINRYEMVGGTLFTAGSRGVLRYDPSPTVSKK